jgi:hypothetical protein
MTTVKVAVVDITVSSVPVKVKVYVPIFAMLEVEVES